MGLELPVWGAPTAAWVVATLGLVGASVLDRFLDDDGSDDGGSGGTGGGDDDPFGGDMGGMGGGGMGGDDGFDDLDGMGEFDEMDGFDDGGGGGAATDELENRLDELENEVASLSSTVSTVRSENGEISNAVDDIEEDVRNLLDIYEMVTRGINPFVDESSGFDDVAGGGEGSFGLFDDADETDDAAADLDDDVAEADAEGFFDDDLLDDDGGFDDEFDETGGDLDEEAAGLDGEFDEPDGDSADAPGGAASETDTADDGDDMNDDGKSFSELKEEYDSGEADWADEADDDAPADDGADSFDDPGTESAAPDDGFESDLGDGSAVGDDFAGGFDDEPADPAPADDTGGRASEPEPAPDRQPGGDPAEASDDGFEYVGRDDLSDGRDGGKPYLTELPGDYVGDLLVMEWLEFLVSESDVTDAVRAINYYERIEWVSADAAARLREFLSGFGTIDRNLVDRPGTDRLVREHHTRSLRYITQLNGTDSHLMLLDRWDDLAGGSLVGGDTPPSSDASRSRDRRGPRSNGDSHADRGRNGGGSGRPMTDPDPHPDRIDPADTGWGDGR